MKNNGLFLSVISLFLIAFFVGCQASSTEEAKRFVPPEEIAQNSLVDVAKLRNLNLKELKLEHPFEKVFCGLDPLRAYKSGDDPGNTLEPYGDLLYPVSDSKGVQAYVIIGPRDGEWSWVESGRTMGVLYANRRAELIKTTGLEAKEFFILEVSGLNRYYVAYRQNGELFLALVLEDRQLGLAAGQIVPAKQFFEKLREEALHIEDRIAPGN